MKFITHGKRLNQTSPNSLELMESRLLLLGGKVGPVLFELPPHFPNNLVSASRRFLTCFFAIPVTPSSSATRVGTRTKFSIC